MNEFSWLAELGITTILCIVIAVLAWKWPRRSRSNGNSKDKQHNDPIQDGLDEAFGRVLDIERNCSDTRIRNEARMTRVEENYKTLDKKVDNISEDIRLIKNQLLGE
jgi:archaellum component FlaC